MGKGEGVCAEEGERNTHFAEIDGQLQRQKAEGSSNHCGNRIQDDAVPRAEKRARRTLLLFLLPLRAWSLEPRRKPVLRGVIGFATDGRCRWELQK